MEDFATNPHLKKLLEDTLQTTVNAFKFAVMREHLQCTDELLNSIRAGAVEQSKDFITGSVSFSELLRIKDMKNLHYTTIPPLGPIMEWVEKKGVASFPYVPGYGLNRTPNTEIQSIVRIARGVQYALKSHPNVRRGYRGVYNEELKHTVLPNFYLRMRQFAIQYAQNKVREEFGIEVYNMELNFASESTATRVSAAINARDTKLARKYALNLKM